MQIYAAIVLTLTVVAMDKPTDIIGLMIVMPIFGRIFGWW